MSDDEWVRARKFHREADRFQFVASRTALRHVLGRALDRSPSEISFSVDCWGKPHIVGSQLRFSLSHSAEKCAIAFSDIFNVGIDIEKVAPIDNLWEIAEGHFLSSECSYIRHGSSGDELSRFYAIWTGKESVLKAIGMGLRVEPHFVEIMPWHKRARWAGPTAPYGTDWWLKMQMVERDTYVLTVASA